jgi:hypothetical protein
MNKPESSDCRKSGFFQMIKRITNAGHIMVQSQNNYFCQTYFKFYAFTDLAITASDTRGNY